MNIARFILPFLLLGWQINAYADVKMVTGAGATFPYPVYAEWAKTYNEKYGLTIDYQPVGSGRGIRAMIDEKIDQKNIIFGASDKPLSPEELNQNGLFQFPTLLGAIIPIYNINIASKAPLKLTGGVLGDIFAGQIKQWNDPKIAQLNPNIQLPEQDIKVIYRSDVSGSSFIFSHYLATVNSFWKNLLAKNSQFAWPVGKGSIYNEGVAAEVQSTPGAIGYVEYAFIKNTTLKYALIQNQAGQYTEPSIQSIQAAFSHSTISETGTLMPNSVDKHSWPIASATYIFMKEEQPKSTVDSACVAIKFFKWAYKNGKKEAFSLNYAPIPNTQIASIEAQWKKKFSSDHKPLNCLE